MIDKTDAQILAEAREYMEQNGRTTGTMCNDDGSVCLLGAIAWSQGMGYLSEEDLMSEEYGLDGAVTTLTQVIRKQNAQFFRDDPAVNEDYIVVRFNDHVCPDPEDDQKVLDTLAKAEKIALNDGIDPDAA